MKNKTTVLKNIDQLRIDIKNINTLIFRPDTTDDQVFQAFKTAYERLDNIEGLVDIEIDPYKSNQIL